MIFAGISRRFSTIDEQQYEALGEYWDYFSNMFGRDNILGLGLHWEENSLEYIIGTTENKLTYDLDRIREKYSDAVYKEVTLPDTGWQEYDGLTEELGAMYGAIYEDGPLTYEIEAFSEDGRCHLMITREQ